MDEGDCSDVVNGGPMRRRTVDLVDLVNLERIWSRSDLSEPTWQTRLDVPKSTPHMGSLKGIGSPDAWAGDFATLQ